MWLIRAALRRPISVIIIVVALGLTSILALLRTRIDIFPDLDLPVIYVAQPYGGMSPQQMEGFIAYYYEYHFLYIRHRERRGQVDSRHRAAASYLSSGNQYERSFGADYCLRESRPRIHAAGYSFAICDSL